MSTKYEIQIVAPADDQFTSLLRPHLDDPGTIRDAENVMQGDYSPEWANHSLVRWVLATGPGGNLAGWVAVIPAKTYWRHRLAYALPGGGGKAVYRALAAGATQVDAERRHEAIVWERPGDCASGYWAAGYAREGRVFDYYPSAKRCDYKGCRDLGDMMASTGRTCFRHYNAMS